MRDRILLWFAGVVWKRPLLILVPAIALAIIGGMVAWLNLGLNANTDDLIAPDRPFMADYRRFLDEFGDLEYIYAIVENTGDPQRTEQVVDALTDRLRAIPDLPAVYSTVEPHEQLRIATRAMPEDELAGLATAAGAFETLRSGNAARVLHDASQTLATLIQLGMTMPPEEQERLGAAAVFMLQPIAAAREGSVSEAEMGFLLGRDQQREYFVSDTGRYYFVMIVPVKDYGTLSVIEEPLRQIRAALDDVRRDYPDATIGLTGKPVLQADEMATSNADMTIAASLAFALCAALFMFAFGGVWRPLLAVIAFGCAAAWTYGFATLTYGQLNLLSIVFMLVLIGVGMDYGVHMLSRYREYRMMQSVHRSVANSVLNAGRGNLTGALTSSTVFFMALLTTFQGLRELGLIAGTGLLLCVAAMTLVLPALLVMVDGRRSGRNGSPAQPEHRRARTPGFIRGIGDFMVRRPWVALVAAALFTIGLVAIPGHQAFDHNLLNLQAEGLDSVQWERRILEDSAEASWFGAVMAEDQEHALEVIRRAQQQPSIGAVLSVFDLIPPQSPQRDRLRRQLHETTLAGLERGQQRAWDSWTVRDLRQPTRSLDLMARGAARQAPEEAARLQQISDDLKHLADALERDDDAASALRAQIDSNVASIASALEIMLEGDQLDLRAALPDALRQRFMSPQGQYLVMMHPRENVWEYEPMREFIEDMRAVDPNVTGAPIAHFESLGEMQNSFITMSLLALLVITVIVLIDFRHVKYIILALIPTLLGLTWLVKTMALLEISFNLANFFSVPILIGLSVDGTVHVLHRYREGGPTRLHLGATRRAVIVTACTTAIGFGCLLLAHHRGLRSLGQVMAMGSILCMIATVVVLPALLAWLERWRSAPIAQESSNQHRS